MAKKWTKLSKLLREGIDEIAPDVYQEFDPTTGKQTQNTYGQVVKYKLLNRAAEGGMDAILEVFDRTEGKAGLAEKPEGGDRTQDERLSDLTRKHINDLAAKAIDPASQPVPAPAAAPAPAKPSTPVHGPKAPAASTGPARRLLDLPSNRDTGAKREGRELGLPPINP